MQHKIYYQFSHLVMFHSLRPYGQAYLSFSAHHQFLQLSESMMPSNQPLSSPSPAFSLTQHHGLFQ